MFMVGVAMPFSIAQPAGARRCASARLLGHARLAAAAAGRARHLSALAGARADQLHLRGRADADRARLRLPVPARLDAAGWSDWCAAAAILSATGRRSRCIRCRRADFDYAAVGVPADWPQHAGRLRGALGQEHQRRARAFDSWFLNLFPRERPFVFNGGGYLTLNFVPSLATMIFGLLAGELLRAAPRVPATAWRLVGLGRRGIALGIGAAVLGIVPDRQAHLDAVVGAVQHRLDAADAGRLLRRHRRARLGRWAFRSWWSG